MRKIDRFQGPKDRLRRGKAHVERLKKRLDTWFKKTPYATVVELDTDGVTKLHKIKLIKAIPVACNDSAIEALEAIRLPSTKQDMPPRSVPVTSIQKRPRSRS